MMKDVFRVRQLLCLLLVLVFTAVLFGCASATHEAAAVDPDPADTAVTDTDGSAADDTAAAEAPAAETSVTDTAASDASGKGFFLTAEYDRLYFAPEDGSEPRLLVDSSTVCTARRGEWLYASFDDGSVRRLSLDGSQITELLPAGSCVYRKLIPYDGGFIGAYYSLLTGAGYDICRDDTQTPEPLFADDWAITPWVTGRYLYCYRYGDDDMGRLMAFDLESLELVWEIPVDKSLEMMPDESGILCFVPNSGKLFRLDEDARTLIPTGLPLTNTDYELIASFNGACFVQGNYSDGFRYYLVNQNGRRELDGGLPDYAARMDVRDGKVLLQYYSSGESAADGNVWYTQECFKTLDLESGEISDFPVLGQYGALFAAGDFPVLDSSTARKPVTSEIYAFFCEGTGAGGAVPLCSTTHGAWLNIADGTADLALLAAPTQEEQDYLDERGVSVEMKLYGGDGLVFIGSHACGVENLSLEQVRGIYRGEITNWAQLGGADHAIRVLYRDDQSGSQRLFERMLWKDEPVPDFESLGFDRLDDMSTIVSECVRDPYAIGYSIMTYLRDVYSKEELLAFSLEGYAATPENVAARNYPLGTQGYVVIRSDEPENSPARRLFDWFGSPLSDVILTRNGVTPLHG